MINIKPPRVVISGQVLRKMRNLQHCSGNQKTMSSLIILGPNVKPNVSKRQREKFAQATSSSLMANKPLQDNDLTLRNG